MLIKCSDCGAELEAIKREAPKIKLLTPLSYYYVPKHRASWQVTTDKSIHRVCNRSLMKVLKREIINYED